MDTITQAESALRERFEGFAFIVAKVQYIGPTDTCGAAFCAMIRRDGKSWTAYRSYRSEEPDGERQAVHAAEKCLAEYLDGAIGHENGVSDYAAIPGDLDADSYSFTFVPAYFFEGVTS